MSSSLKSRARRRGPAGVAAVAALAVTATLTTGAGPAASIPPDPCPEAFPTAELVDGDLVTGLTVSQGTEPDGFTGEVLGVLDDGIAPDLDMILVRLTSAEIDRVGGIWAGMSGSPVYAADGRLIGAVAYGLSWGSSPVAGVTPAQDMYDVLDDAPPSPPRAAAKVALPPRTARRLVASGTVSARQADAGLSRLVTPLAVSGMSSGKRLTKATKRLGLEGVRVYRSGAAPVQRALPDPMVAGGNLGAALSYGDFSAVGIGTITALCDGQVVGFGHPMQWSGETSMTMHSADAVLIQEDSLGSPFKVANPGGPVGTVTRDRLAGIAGPLGDLPATTEVTSTATSGSRTRTGTTVVSFEDYLPDLAALGVVANNARVFDQAGEGTAEASFTIEGTTDGGAEFSLTRDNVAVSRWDIAYMAPEELYYTLYRILENKFTGVDIDSVTATTELSSELRRYSMGATQVKIPGSGWTSVRRGARLRVSPGDVLQFRIDLESFRDELEPQQLTLSVPVPPSFKSGHRGFLGLTGGSSFYRRVRAASFPELVETIEGQPSADQVMPYFYNYVTDRRIEGEPGERTGNVITGRKSFMLIVR